MASFPCNGSPAKEEDKDCDVNPCPPSWLDNTENALLRGDAIGDTAYSHRWVLKCLFNIFQDLPKYMKGLSSKERDSEQNEESKSSNEEKETVPLVIELDSNIEDSACQLWDMTVERDVTLHILKMEEIDAFLVISMIIEQSLAPRLTEVMVGVLANICCQEEGCTKLLEEHEGKELLVNLVNLVGRTSDVPTLIEAFRLMRLVVWHRINRTPKSTLATCPLIKLLCQEYCRNSMTFILQNSLSDSLILSVLELLSSLLFICLPETSLQVSSLFSQKEMVEALLAIVKKKGTSFDGICEDDLQMCHRAVTTLYAFIDTPGAIIIQKSAATDPDLEGALFGYVEYHGKYENPEDLVGETSDRLCCALGLCQLIIPHMRSASLIMTVGRLLGVIHGQTHQYSVSRSNSTEEGTHDLQASSHLSVNQQTRRRRSSEKRDLEFTNNRELTRLNSGGDMKVRSQDSTSEPQIECGWLSPPSTIQDIVPRNSTKESQTRSDLSETASSRLESTDTESAVLPLCPEIITGFNKEDTPAVVPPATIRESPEPMQEEDGIPPELAEALSSLLETLEDYCFQLIASWWSSEQLSSAKEDASLKSSFPVNLFDILDQCHAHEVVFILDAVRKKDQWLVPKLQEYLLDSGSHSRLVAILAHMYQ